MRYRAIESVLPSRRVSNDEVLRRIAEDSRAHLSETELRRILRLVAFAFRSMGTVDRFGCAPGERPYELCAEAGRRALRAVGVAPGEVDLLIYVGVGRGFLEPATANVFQDLLGLHNATGFDVMDACASWLRGVQIARTFLEAGTYNHVLILNAEFNGNLESYELTSVDEFQYRFPSFTIGEAATATLVSRSDDGRDDEFRAEFRNYGDQRDRCLIPLPNWTDYLAAPESETTGHLEPHRFVSHGRDIMEFGQRKLVELFHKHDAFHAWDPDIVFFHAASDGMSREGMRECGMDESRGYYTHGRFGNTVSATVPMGMAAAIEEGRLRDGMKVLLAVASAGISVGLARFRFDGAR